MTSSRVFWVFFTVLVAIASHLSYVLFVPANQLQNKINAVVNEHGVNQLAFAIAGSAAAQIVQHPDELVYAVCPFDLSRGPLLISSRVPDDYWSLEVYNERGGTIYTINDQQVPRKQFNLELYDDDPDPQTIVNTAQSSSSSSLITILTGSTKGVVIIRSAGATQLERTRSLEALKSSSCSVKN